MLHNIRRLSSYGLCCVLLVSCLFLTPTKAAVDYPDDGVGFWKMMSGWVGVRAIKAFLDIPEADATDSDWQRAYDLYVDDMQTSIGTTTLTNGGVRVYFTPKSISSEYGTVTDLSSGRLISAAFAPYASRPDGGQVITKFNGITVPFAATVVRGHVFSGTSNATLLYYQYGTTTTVTAGSVLGFADQNAGSSNDNWSVLIGAGGGNFSLLAYADLIPITGSISDYYEVDLSSDIRLGSLSNSWAYVGDDGIVHVDNSQLFNEITNIFYNPATNENLPVTDWNYDYSDRSYGITLGDGRIAKIVYGDENASVNLQDSNGNTITYNYYYTSPDGSGGGSGDGEDGEGNWFTDLLKKLGELLGGVIGGLFEVVGNALLTILDSLITLVSSSVERLSNLVNLFGSFGDALSVLWSWLPPDIVTILVAGVTVIVMVAVVKMFL